MSLLGAITAKPWLPEPTPPPLGPVVPAARVGLRVLLAVITTLFGLFLLAFLIRAQLPDWQALVGTAGRPLASLAPLWLNTALLLAGSLAMQAASVAARRDSAVAMRIALAAGGLFALAFLVGQGLVWQRFIAMGHFVASNPAASFFYLLTAVHGLHLAGGLVAWARVHVRARHGATAAGLRLSVELCAVYWHFLFAVWLVLFALLASPQQSLRALAEICGIR